MAGNVANCRTSNSRQGDDGKVEFTYESKNIVHMSELAKQSGDATLTSNLRRLVIVRSLAIVGESAAVVGAVYGLKMPLPLLQLLDLKANQ